MTLTTKLLIAIAVALMIASGSFSGGWLVKGWKDQDATVAQQAKDLKQEQANSAALAKQAKDARDSDNALIEKMNQWNQQTQDADVALLAALGVQDNAIHTVQKQILVAAAGGCSFTADADGLFQRAYQAAFGTSPAAGNTDAGKTSGSDAANRKPTTTAKVLQHEPSRPK